MSHKRYKVTIIVLLVAALLSAACLVIALMFANATVKAPDLAGMTLMEAEKCGQESDLIVKDGQMVDGDDSDRGTVVEQYPAAGTSLKPGEVVMVKISRGPGDGRTPDVTNMTTEDARRIIETSGFQVGNINQVEGVEKAGTVLAQNPKGNIEYERGKTINIDVSDGSMVYVPNIVGKNATTAIQTLKNNGLSGKWAGNDFSSKIDYGCVLKQSPAAGAKVKRGTYIQVWLSAGAEEDQEFYYYDSPPEQPFFN